MNISDLGFFIVDDEINIKDGPVTITVDHEVIMSIEDTAQWNSLKSYEREFAAWYQEQILIEGMPPEISFIVSSSLIEPYDQEKLCEQILNFLRSPTVEDPDLN